jgi:hypothetical protein
MKKEMVKDIEREKKEKEKRLSDISKAVARLKTDNK